MNNTGTHGPFSEHQWHKPWGYTVVNHISCPFCGHPGIPAKPGKAFCHECQYNFFIDDRVECIFADPLNLRLPLKGTVCPVCGLIQGEDTDHCVYCNAKLNSIASYC